MLGEEVVEGLEGGGGHGGGVREGGGGLKERRMSGGVWRDKGMGVV